MRNQLKHYINGEWVESTGSKTQDVINPATEEVMGTISMGTKEDLDRAVSAARAAFPSFSQTTKEERIEMLENIAEEYKKRKDELIEVMTDELGSPLKISEKVHYNMGFAHFTQAAKSLKEIDFLEDRDGHVVAKDSVGVSGLITPWNFPTNQAATKIASALAAGSPVVLKPSELTPFASMIMAECIDKAGVPRGAFNLVNGTGDVIGDGISSHPDIDLVSFTGSVGTGSKIMKNAADDIKTVSLELGGKSPLIVLDDADVEGAAKAALSNIAMNSGQVCTAATRVLIPSSMKESFEEAIRNNLPNFPVGNPREKSFIGPLVSQDQWERVQSYIEKGIQEGATLIAGGPGKPEGLEKGYFAKPTVFTNVKNDMTIAQEEIFGPVTTIITYDTVDEAIEIGNDIVYGLAGYVMGEDKETLQKVAKGIRAGRVAVNNAGPDFSAPFGGYKQSGIGREWGDYGIDEFLETKSILGFPS